MAMRHPSPTIEIEIPAPHAELRDRQLEIAAITQPIRQRIDDLFQHQGIVVVGVGGGSATGKTSLFPQMLANNYDHVLISEDDYCIGNKRSTSMHGQPNLHVPEDYQVDLMAQHIMSLKRGEEICKPTYSYKTREPDGHELIKPRPLIAIEGEFPLHDAIAPLLDAGIFIDTDDHSRFARRMIRPRRNPQQTDMHRVLEYFSLSFPFYHSHVLPTRKNADMILINRYHPNEGNAYLETIESEIGFVGNESLLEAFRSMFSSTASQHYRYTYYTHPCCTDEETVAMLQHQQSGSEMIYSSQSKSESDGLTVSPSIHFQVEDDVFDLHDIGYNQIGTHEGVLSILSLNNGIHVSCYVDQDQYFLRLSARSTKEQADAMHKLLRQHAQPFAKSYSSARTGIHHFLMNKPQA